MLIRFHCRCFTSHRNSTCAGLVRQLTSSIWWATKEQTATDWQVQSSVQRIIEGITALEMVMKYILQLQKKTANIGEVYQTKISFISPTFPPMNKRIEKVLEVRSAQESPSFAESSSQQNGSWICLHCFPTTILFQRFHSQYNQLYSCHICIRSPKMARLLRIQSWIWSVCICFIPVILLREASTQKINIQVDNIFTEGNQSPNPFWRSRPNTVHNVLYDDWFIRHRIMQCL